MVNTDILDFSDIRAGHFKAAAGPAPVTAPGTCSPARKIQQHLEQLTRLPKAKRRAVMQLLDSVLAQAEL